MWEELFWHTDLIPTLLSILINFFSPISSHFSSVLEVQLSSNSIKYPLFITIIDIALDMWPATSTLNLMTNS